MLAERYDDVLPTWAALQSGSHLTYARHMMVIPAGVVEAGLTIRPRPVEAWGGERLASRLRTVRDGSSFSVLVCPFNRISINYHIERSPSGRYFRIPGVEDPSFLWRHVEKALVKAEELQATVLVFPELTMPNIVGEKLASALRDHGPQGFPLLTVVGCCHEPASSPGGAVVNQAWLLGPDGRELHVHRKLSSYGVAGFSERLEVGQEITVLESPLGNLSVLICLDLLTPGIQSVGLRSHANLLLVPSLSRQTRAHQQAATRYQNSCLASTFVCNRWIDRLQPRAEGQSFYRVPKRKGEQIHDRRRGALWFSLREDLDAMNVRQP